MGGSIAMATHSVTWSRGHGEQNIKKQLSLNNHRYSLKPPMWPVVDILVTAEFL